MARILLDTQVLLWSFFEPRRLPMAVIEEISTSSEVLFSAATIWEVAIKARLGRRDFDFDPEDITRKAIETGFHELPVVSAAASMVAKLPLYHQDPFDRLLVAQAIDEPAHLLTSDRKLSAYSPLVRHFEARKVP